MNFRVKNNSCNMFRSTFGATMSLSKIMSSTGCVAVPQSRQRHRVMMVRAGDACVSFCLIARTSASWLLRPCRCFLLFPTAARSFLTVLFNTSAEHWPCRSCTARCACSRQSSFMLKLHCQAKPTIILSPHRTTAPFFFSFLYVVLFVTPVSPPCHYGLSSLSL